MSYQTTVVKPVVFSGVGLHSGQRVNLVVRPAASDSGIRFHVTRDTDTEPVIVTATVDKVAATSYATSLKEGDLSLHTVEHLLAALSGLGIDNADIDVDAEEVPIMDGSAEPFINGLLEVGIRPLNAPRMVMRMLETIRVEEDGGDKWLEIAPLDAPETIIDYQIDFSHRVVGRQHYRLVLSPETFMAELGSARTFGFAHEVQAMRQVGLARGGSLENAVVIDDEGVMNPEGLRFVDEQVRHKALDLVGDLALLGRRLLGHITAYRSGHGLHTRLAREILAHPEAWELVPEASLVSRPQAAVA
jgi:UDP-3-O-[3-hydroxymyristoyl] N-acetylglucosamine deacetylase